MKKLYDVDCFDDDQVQNQVTIITDLIMDGLQTKKKAQ